MKTIHYLFTFCTFLLLATSLFATHNRAGEIIYRQIGPLTIEASIITYTKASSLPADRNWLNISWGDGSTEVLDRSNGIDADNDGYNDGELICNDYKLNVYTSTHTYAGPAHYIISMTDVNWNAGILNFGFPNSDNLPFILAATVTFFNPQFLGYNSSPVLLEPPTDLAFIGQVFMHTPNGWDPDGDSLSYELTEPIGSNNTNAIYQQVTEIAPGSDNQISIDPVTGLIVWDSPQMAGDYVIAIHITSWRSGSVIDTMIRNIMVTVEEVQNFPPTIQIEGYANGDVLHVAIGDTVRLEITAFDLDANQQITITSTSGLYEFITPPATFTITELTNNSGKALFEWVVLPEHFREYAYVLVTKVKDVKDAVENGAASFATLRLKVEGLVGADSEPVAEQNLTIFPNPVTDILYLDQPLDILNIFDVQGKLIFSAKDLQQVDCRSFPSGTYVLEGLAEQGKKYVSRFVKR